MSKARTWAACCAVGVTVCLGASAGAAETPGGAAQPGGSPPGMQFSLRAQAPAGTPAPVPTYTLTIKESIVLALQNNLDITVESFNPRIREGDIATARAAFDPVFSGAVNANRSRTRGNTAPFIIGALPATDTRTFNFNLQLNDKLPTGATAQLAWTNQRTRSNSITNLFDQGYATALTLTVSQPLLKNFGIDYNTTPIKLAINNREIARSTLTTRIFDVITNVQNAYFDLSTAQQTLEVQRRSLALAEDLVNLNKARVRAGVAPPVEITQAEAQAATRRQAVIAAVKTLRDAEDALRVVLNLPAGSAGWKGTLVPAERPPFQAVTVDLEDALRTAFSKRPELASGKVDIANKELNRRLTRNQLLPDLQAVGSAGLTGLDGVVRTRNAPPIISSGGEGSSLGSLVSGQFNNWSAGLTLTMPLGNRAAEAAYTQAALQEEQSRASLRNLELQITAQVREAVRRIETGAESVEAARVARELAEEQLRVEEARLRLGVTTTFNVLQFQRDLTAAQASEVQAVNEYQKALANLERVQGTVLEKFRMEL